MRNSLLFGGLVSEASSVKAKNIVDPLGKSIMQKNRSTASKIKPSKKRVGIKAALQGYKIGDIIAFNNQKDTVSLGIVVKEGKKGLMRVQLFDNATFQDRNFYFKTEVIQAINDGQIASRVRLSKTNVDNIFYLPETERSRILGRDNVIQRTSYSILLDLEDDISSDSQDELEFNEKRILSSQSMFRVSRFQRKKWEKAQQRAIRVRQRQQKAAIFLVASEQKAVAIKKPSKKRRSLTKVVKKVDKARLLKKKPDTLKRSKSPQSVSPAALNLDLDDIMSQSKKAQVTEKKQARGILRRKSTLKSKPQKETDNQNDEDAKKQQVPKKKAPVFKFFNRKASLGSSTIKPSKEQQQEEKRAREVQQNKGKIGHQDLCVISNSFGTHQREFVDKYDIVFILDTTGSMSSSLPKVVQAIGQIVQNISTISDLSTKFACVSYTDHAPDDGGYGNPPVKYFPHNSLQLDDNKDKAMEFVQGLNACGGGGAGGQAVVDGLHYANTEIPFREGSERMYILVLDQGPHGEQFAGAKYQYPKGCPCGIDWKQKLGEMKDNNVEFLFIKCGNQLENTVKLFGQAYGEKWSVMSLDDFQNFDDKIVNYVCGLLRHNYKLSKK